MTTQDKQLTCSDCRKTFIFTIGEQQYFATKGYTNEPKRCPACRAARKQRISGSSASYSAKPRQMFPAKCATCGKDTEVPFEPTGVRPVYCRDCYVKRYPPKRF